MKAIALAVVALLVSSCETPTEEAVQPTVSDNMAQVVALTSSDQQIMTKLCQVLKQKRSVFRSLHVGNIFKFQIKETICGTTKQDAQVEARLEASIGQAMTWQSQGSTSLFFSDVLTDQDGITGILCQKLAQGQLSQNTISLSDVEKIQLRMNSDMSERTVLEIRSFVSEARGQFKFQQMQSLDISIQTQDRSDFPGKVKERVLSRKCPNDGSFSSHRRQVASF